MFILKRLSIFMIAAFAAITIVGAQSNAEMSVEGSYLQETIELMIIRETARSGSREQKSVALQFIGEMIDRGNKNDEIRQTLDFLSREGVNSTARESGRVMNNFPDVRRQSAKYLGLIGTEEARKTLLEICRFENEPMVLQEAIKSLGDIGVNDENDTINHISWIFSRFDNLNPDNLMALATVDAFENIARKNGGIDSVVAIQTLIRITEGMYITPVKQRARELLSELRGYSY